MIFNYLGETLDEIYNLTLVSKGVNEDCKRHGIEWKIIPTYEITPRLKSTRTLLRKLVYNQINKNEKFNHYQRIKINRINEFDQISAWDVEQILKTKLEINHICYGNNKMAFDISLPPSSLEANYRRAVDPTVIINIIRCLFQNNDDHYNNKIVQEINLSNIIFPPHATDGILLYLCSLSIKKITWNHSKDNVHLAGFQLHAAKCSLKEIIMDDTDFLVRNCYQFNLISDLIGHTKDYIFHDCISLERLSINNAKCSSVHPSLSQRVDVPQNALIKFVRNAPTTLNWFRSDLTQENINMLKKERPDIEFL
jgi:hypothetical protein